MIEVHGRCSGGCVSRRPSAWHKRLYNQLSFFSAARGLGAAVTTREFFDAPGRIDKLLFAGEKWMTSGTDADFNVTTRRARMINRAARADDITLVIFWMNARFHVGWRARNVTARGMS